MNEYTVKYSICSGEFVIDGHEQPIKAETHQSIIEEHEESDSDAFIDWIKLDGEVVWRRQQEVKQ